MRILVKDPKGMAGDAIAFLQIDGCIVRVARTYQQAALTSEIVIYFGLTKEDEVPTQENPILIILDNTETGLLNKSPDIGIVDYLLTPINLQELKLRIQSLSNRKKLGPGTATPVGTMKFMADGRTVRHSGKNLLLTKREFLCLKVLAEAKSVVSPNELRTKVYGDNSRISTNAIEYHISQLRKKLSNGQIRNFKNTGYSLVER